MTSSQPPDQQSIRPDQPIAEQPTADDLIGEVEDFIAVLKSPPRRTKKGR